MIKTINEGKYSIVGINFSNAGLIILDLSIERNRDYDLCLKDAELKFENNYLIIQGHKVTYIDNDPYYVNIEHEITFISTSLWRIVGTIEENKE